MENTKTNAMNDGINRLLADFANKKVDTNALLSIIDSEAATTVSKFFNNPELDKTLPCVELIKAAHQVISDNHSEFDACVNQLKNLAENHFVINAGCNLELNNPQMIRSGHCGATLDWCHDDNSACRSDVLNVSVYHNVIVDADAHTYGNLAKQYLVDGTISYRTRTSTGNGDLTITVANNHYPRTKDDDPCPIVFTVRYDEKFNKDVSISLSAAMDIYPNIIWRSMCLTINHYSGKMSSCRNSCGFFSKSNTNRDARAEVPQQQPQQYYGVNPCATSPVQFSNIIPALYTPPYGYPYDNTPYMRNPFMSDAQYMGQQPMVNPNAYVPPMTTQTVVPTSNMVNPYMTNPNQVGTPTGVQVVCPNGTTNVGTAPNVEPAVKINIPSSMK